MFTLIALGTGVAWIYSIVATLTPGVFPPAFRGMDGAVPVYFEAAAVIVTHDTRMTHHADRTIEIVDGVLRS